MVRGPAVSDEDPREFSSLGQQACGLGTHLAAVVTRIIATRS